MIRKIEEILKERLDACKNKVFPFVNLTMKNGDYVSIEAPSTWKWGGKKFTLVTEDDEIIRFDNLKSVAEWIAQNYC